MTSLSIRRGWLTLCLLACVCFTLIATTPVQAYPEPSVVARSWELEFEYRQPRAIALRGVDGKVQWYWYITYQVTNNTGRERLFIPELTIATAEGDLVRASKNVPALVFTRIKHRVDNRLLESPAQVVGKILLGEDNARESVIIWPAFKHDVTRVTVFVGGLSGETQEVPNPVTGDTVLVNKTLMIDFDLPGNPVSPQEQAVVPKGKEWVMR